MGKALLFLVIVCLVAVAQAKNALKHQKKELKHSNHQSKIEVVQHEKKHLHHAKLVDLKTRKLVPAVKRNHWRDHSKRGHLSDLEKKRLMQRMQHKKRWMAHHKKRGMKNAQQMALKLHKKGHMMRYNTMMSHKKRGHFRNPLRDQRIQDHIRKRLQHDRKIFQNRRRLQKRIHHLENKKVEIKEYLDTLKRLKHMKRGKKMNGNDKRVHHEKKLRAQKKNHQKP